MKKHKVEIKILGNVSSYPFYSKKLALEYATAVSKNYEHINVDHGGGEKFSFNHSGPDGSDYITIEEV